MNISKPVSITFKIFQCCIFKYNSKEMYKWGLKEKKMNRFIAQSGFGRNQSLK